MQTKKKNKLKPIKKLSILVAQDGLSFCVSIDKNIQYFSEQKFTSKQSPKNLLKEIQSFFSYSFEENTHTTTEVRVYYAHPLFALVPNSYFDKKHLSDYLKFNMRLLPTDEFNYDHLNNIEANLVYVPYTNINNYLFEKFGEFTYQHLVSHFVDECQVLIKNVSETVYVNVFTKHFDLCIFKNNQLLLCNSFDYHSPEDFVYYILFALEQLKLDKEKLELFLSGNIDKDTKIYNLLYTYIRRVYFNENKNNVKISDKVLNKKLLYKHQFFLNTI